MTNQNFIGSCFYCGQNYTTVNRTEGKSETEVPKGFIWNDLTGYCSWACVIADSESLSVDETVTALSDLNKLRLAATPAGTAIAQATIANVPTHENRTNINFKSVKNVVSGTNIPENTNVKDVTAITDIADNSVVIAALVDAFAGLAEPKGFENLVTELEQSFPQAEPEPVKFPLTTTSEEN